VDGTQKEMLAAEGQGEHACQGTRATHLRRPCTRYALTVQAQMGFWETVVPVHRLTRRRTQSQELESERAEAGLRILA
jgi:hypothetical protein